MKKNKFLLVILGILILLTGIFIYKNSDSTLNHEQHDFAIKDTASISKIFIADRNGNQITLERKKNSSWILNGKDEVRPEYLKLLFDCFYRISIRTKVARSAYNNVVKAL